MEVCGGDKKFRRRGNKVLAGEVNSCNFSSAGNFLLNHAKFTILMNLKRGISSGQSLE
jgi:hypothetical protein